MSHTPTNAKRQAKFIYLPNNALDIEAPPEQQ